MAARNGRVLRPITCRMAELSGLHLRRCRHGQQHVDTPKMPGEPKRVQPSRDTDRKNTGDGDSVLSHRAAAGPRGTVITGMGAGCPGGFCRTGGATVSPGWLPRVWAWHFSPPLPSWVTTPLSQQQWRRPACPHALVVFFDVPLPGSAVATAGEWSPGRSLS